MIVVIVIFDPYNIYIFPREARAEGPSVARLINLSGRRSRSGAKPCEFEPNIYFLAKRGPKARA